MCWSSSVVEHVLGKDGVTGSIPVSSFLRRIGIEGSAEPQLDAARPHGSAATAEARAATGVPSGARDGGANPRLQLR